MADQSIEQIRTATFPLARRGYERREVDEFLSELADWLESGGGDEARQELVKRELERVGERTSAILAAAEDSAERTRVEAEEDARFERREADEYSQRTRGGADEYAEATVNSADAEAKRLITEAEEKSARIVADGESRREDIEMVIADLVSRRDGVLAEIESLRNALKGAIEAHRPGAAGDRFARPAELDPAERLAEEPA